MVARGPQNGERGLERLLGARSNFYNSFFDPSIPSMRKGQDGEKMVGKENNGENSCPLTLLPDDRQMATDCNTDSSYQK